MTQKELAYKAGVSLPAIAKIISGQRLGSVETWKKIMDVLPSFGISKSSGNFIDELQEEIFEYGESQEIVAFYSVMNGCIIFEDYAFDEDLANPNFNKDGLAQLNSIRITLKEALELFKCQNEII